MVSVNALNSFFYNRSNSLINFNELYPKANIITRHQGVPKYAYSLSTNRYIPSAGVISLEDFKSVRCQTACVAIQTTAYGKLPQNRVTNHPDIALNVNGTYLDIVLQGRLIAKVWAHWTKESSGGYGGYRPNYKNVFHYLQVQVHEINRYYVLSNRYDFNSLGYNDNTTLRAGNFNYVNQLITLVIVEDLNFNV